MHAVGTARLARLGLRDVDVCDAVGAVPRPDLLPDAALLYPSAGSRDLASLAPSERPGQLVVLDGTWRHARRLFLDNPWLAELPHVHLRPEEPSRYRIRKQPGEHCVSTLESLVCALRILEPETKGLDELLSAFDSMIDEQQEFMQRPAAKGRYQQRAPRAARAVPTILLEQPQRLLVVYGESAPGPALSAATSEVSTDVDSGPHEATGAAAACGPRQLIRWSAVRPGCSVAEILEGAAGASGSSLAGEQCPEVFDALIRPETGSPQPGHLAHMGLDPAEFEGARPMVDVARDWRAFRRPDDLVLAWHPAVLRMLGWLDPMPGETFALRALWANVTHRKMGSLADVVEQAQLDRPHVPLRGRAAERLAEAVAVAHELVRSAPRVAHLGRRPT